MRFFNFRSAVRKSFSRRTSCDCIGVEPIIEQLEVRLVLSAVVNPTLTVITHGYNSGGGLDDEQTRDWIEAIQQQTAITLRNESAVSAPKNTVVAEVGFSNWTLPSIPANTNLTILVSWNSHSGSASPTATSLATLLNQFLAGYQQDEWDMLLIGYSRGAMLNAKLVAALGDVESVDYTTLISLDGTGVIDHGDVSPSPAVVPRWVDRVVGYDDGHTLQGLNYVPTPYYATNPISVRDGFDFRRSDNSTDGILNQDVGDLVDIYLNSSDAADYFTRNPWFGSASWSNAAYHSVVSHQAIHEWYRTTGALYLDLRLFLRLKDAGQTSEPNEVSPKPMGPTFQPSLPPTGISDDFGNRADGTTVINLSLTFDSTTPGAIDYSGDSDWFKVTTRRTGWLKVVPAAIDGSLDSVVTLYNTNGAWLDSDDSKGPGIDAQSWFSVLANQTYYIEVAGARNSTGGYHLLVSQPDSPPPIDPMDQPSPAAVVVDDYPDTKATARLISLDGRGSATISGSIKSAFDNTDDNDWFQFVAKQTGKLVIDIGTPNSSLDTHLRLHNASVLMAQGNDRVEANVTAGQTYWLHVRSGGDGGSGEIQPGEDRIGKYVVHIHQPTIFAGGSGTDTPEGPLPLLGNVHGVLINLDANGNGQSSGSVDDPGDERWFEIHGPSEGNMVVQVLPVNDDLKPFVTALRSNFGGIDTDTGEFDHEGKVGFRVSAGETILVAVSSHGGRSNGGFTINVSQPGSLPDDDVNDFGETPRDLGPQLTQEGDGSFQAKIETSEDNDWFEIPIRGSGFFSIDVSARDSGLVPFLELSRDGTSGGFFETDDGRDGHAKISFLPDPGQTTVWAKVSSVDDTQGTYTLTTWRTRNPDDDYPDSGGVFLPRHELAPRGQLFISGRFENPGDSDNFHIRVNQPGPVAVQVISLTEGMTPFFSRARQSADPDQRTGTSGVMSGRGGRAFEMVMNMLPADDNWLVIDVQPGGDSTVPFGDYIVQIWQPGSNTDLDADTVGIEASPILLSGSGNGNLPGAPNGNVVTPALDYSGDKDVFEVVAAGNRPITFTVDGSAVSQGTFLRIYDASGHAVATDYNSGPNNASQITLDANDGDLFYVEVTAFDGSSTGSFSVGVSQATDDHPDTGVFVPKLGQVRDATLITLDSTGFGQGIGQIEASLVGDRDYFQVVATERGQMTVDVIGTDDTLDTYLRVYDSHGNLVAIDDDGGDIRNSRVTFAIFQDEIYSIVVSGYNDQSVGAYQVKVQTSSFPQDTFVGNYDHFSAGQLNDLKWSRRGSSGTGSIQQSGGILRLSADGAGANVSNNSVDIFSRASVVSDIDFDFTALVATGDPNANGNIIELTDFTHYLGFDLRPDGSGGIRLTPRAGGYSVLQSIDYLTLTPGSSHHVKFNISEGQTAVILDGTELASYVGPLWSNTALRCSVLAAQVPVYDAFDDNSIDANRWNTSGDVVETDGRLHLWMRHNGNLQDSRATTQNKTNGQNIHGFKLNADRTAGTVSGGQTGTWVGITNGSDYVRMSWLSDVNQLIVESGGAYGEGHPAARWDPDSPGAAETPDGPIEIRERNGNIEFLHNNVVQYTLTNQSIRAGSWFEAVAFGQNGEGGPLNRDYELMIDDLQLYMADSHLAVLELDNVSGTFLLPADPVEVPYDNFDDNQINHDKFQVTGTVEEREGALKLSLFRQGMPVSGYVSTNGNPDGTDLRGFRLNANRTTQPKLLSSDDARARMRLTNGQDFIEIEWKFQSHIFQINTSGAYGVQHIDIPAPADQVPDGPLEVRERDGNIDVLHNGQVKLTLFNQTIRAGSFFTFETDGLIAGGNPVVDPPQDFDAFIDDLVFYHDPIPNNLRVTPTLKTASDNGASNTDHVTNQLTLDFEWIPGPTGTTYQWREGKLEDDGDINFGDWSDPQSATTATVTLPGASVHVFSVRPISSQGLVGEESSRGIQVDIANPTLANFEVLYGAESRLAITFSEPIIATLSNIVIRDSANQIVIPVSIAGSGTSTLDVVLPALSRTGTFSVTQIGIMDIAGNAVITQQVGTFDAPNMAPTDISLSNNSIPENAANSVIGTLSAIDPDVGNTHTYAIQPGGDGAQFVIVGNQLKTGAGGLDFETQSSYSVRIRVTDQGGLTFEKIFTVNVTDLNEVPIIATNQSFAIAENSVANAVVNIVVATDQDLTAPFNSRSFSITAGNTDNAFVISSSTGQISVNNPTALDFEFSPIYTLVISLSDGGGGVATPTPVVIQLVDLDEAPSITDIGDQSILEDGMIGTLSFNIGDPESLAGELVVEVTSSNQGLIPDANLLLTGTGVSRGLVVMPLADQVGASTITVSVSDGVNISTNSFLMTVVAVNDFPTLSSLQSQTIQEDSSTGELTFIVGDVDSSVSGLTVTATSSNTALIPNAAIVIEGAGVNRSLVATPVANQSGTAMITVTVSDGVLTTSQEFQVMVNPVDDLPVISINPQPLVYHVSSKQILAIDSAASISDDDTLNLNLNGAVLRVSGQSRKDQLSILEQGGIAKKGKNVQFNGTVIGTQTGGKKGVPLTFNLNSAATLTGVQAMLRAIGFKSTDKTGGNRVLQTQITSNLDETNTAPATRTIQVGP